MSPRIPVALSLVLIGIGGLLLLSSPSKPVEDITRPLSKRCYGASDLPARYASSLIDAANGDDALISAREVCAVEDGADDVVGFSVSYEGDVVPPRFLLARPGELKRDVSHRDRLVRHLRRMNGTDVSSINVRDEQLSHLRHVVPGAPTTGPLISACYVTGTLAAPSVSYEDPFAAEQVAYIQFTTNKINARGIDVNGTVHQLQLIEYDDAGIAELTGILSALCADYNITIIGFVIGNNLAAVTTSEALRQPTVNGEGNLLVPLAFPRGLNWTVSIAPSPLQFAIPCLGPLEAAGAHSIAWAAVNTLSGLGTVLNTTIALYHLNMTIDTYDYLNTTLMSSQQATTDYLNPFIDEWEKLNGGTGPDLLIIGGTNDQQTEWMVTSIRIRYVTTGFNPRAMYIYNVLNDDAFRNVTDWMTRDAVTDSPYSKTYNFTSVVFGNTQEFEKEINAVYGSTGNDGFRAVNVAAVELIPQIYERAGTLDKTAVRAAMHSSVGNPFQTILGPIQIGPTGVPTKSIQFCWQRGADPTVLTPLTTPSLSDSAPVEYPMKTIPTQAFIDENTPPTFFESTGWKIMLAILLFAIACATVIAVVWIVRAKYHVAFLNKDVGEGSW